MLEKEHPLKTQIEIVPRNLIDFSVENYGSIYLLRPQTNLAREWVETNIGPDNGYQPYFPTIVVEHRYIGDIVQGIQNDGLAVGR